MKVSRPGAEGGLLLCLFLLCVKNDQITVHAKAQISFGEDTPKPKEKTKEDPEVGTRTGANSQQRQGGLLADILGVDPLGRPQDNFPNNEGSLLTDFPSFGSPTSSCCCTTFNSCPQTNAGLNDGQLGDEDGFDGLKPRGGPQKDQKRPFPETSPRKGGSELDSLKAGLGVRIVNDAPDEPIGGCPAGTKECCYPSHININSFGSQCFPPSGSNQNIFVPWDQVCLQRVDNFGQKQCGQRFYTTIEG